MGSSIATSWVDAVVAAGGNAASAAAGAEDLVRRYAEPHRRYHTATHVAAVLRDSAALAGELGHDSVQRAVVALAACAHDVVYDARPGDDERASARWAHDALSAAGVRPDLVEDAVRLVLATLAHDAAVDDTAAAALLDADLAILAAEPPAYSAYVLAVRAEYAAVADEQWRAGRAAVLSTLLDRPRLYLSEPGRRRWESAARVNVRAELAQLAGTA
jgi:predicted metal-dependent HD superfamily phosphohydrolase